MSTQTQNSATSASAENADQISKWSYPISNSIRAKLTSSHSDYSLTEVFCAMLCALFGSITSTLSPTCMDDLTSKGCQTQSSFFSPMKILKIAEELPFTTKEDKLHEYQKYNDIYDKDSKSFKFLDPSAFTYKDKEALIAAIDSEVILNDEAILKLTGNMAFVTDYINWLLELTVKDFAVLIRTEKLHIRHNLSRRGDKTKENGKNVINYTETEDEFDNRKETKINELALTTMLECHAWCHGMGRIINMLFKEEDEEDKTKCFENDENNMEEVYFSGFDKCQMHPLNIVCDAITNMPLNQIDKMRRSLQRCQTNFQIGEVSLQKKYALFENNNTTVDKFSIQKMLSEDLKNAFVYVENGNMAPHLFTKTNKKRMWSSIKSRMSKQCVLATQSGFNVDNIFMTKKVSGKRKKADDTSKLLDEANKKLKQTDTMSKIQDYMVMKEMYTLFPTFMKYRTDPIGMEIVEEAVLDRGTVKLSDGCVAIAVTEDEIIAWNNEFQKRKSEEEEQPEPMEEEEEEGDSSSGSEDGNNADEA